MDERIRQLLSGYVDGELSDEDRRIFESELAQSAQLREELGEFRKLKEVTGIMRYADLPDEVWATYWESLYRKLERQLGWILFSLGAVLLLGYGLIEGLGTLYTNSGISPWIKVGVTGLGAGTIVLLVSLIRERLFAYHRDRYREVMK